MPMKNYRALIPVKVMGTLDKWNPAAWKTEAFLRQSADRFHRAVSDKKSDKKRKRCKNRFLFLSDFRRFYRTVELNDFRLESSARAIVSQNVHYDGIAGFEFPGDFVKGFQIGDANAIDSLKSGRLHFKASLPLESLTSAIKLVGLISLRASLFRLRSCRFRSIAASVR